jgi:hypothetical protein
MRNPAFIEARIPRQEHRFRKIDVVAHHTVETGIRRAMLQALFNVRSELRFLELLYVQHCDIGHGLPSFLAVALTGAI